MREEFIGRLASVLAGDPRIRAVVLTGSLGRGEADDYSDVDSQVIVAPGSYGEVVDCFARVAEPLGPFLLARRIPHTTVFTHVLTGWLRWHAFVVAADSRPPLIRGEVDILVDRDGLELLDAPVRHVDLAAVESTTVEFLRCLALLPVVVGRNDPVTGVSGAMILRQLTIQLLRLLDEPGVTSGGLHLRRCLGPDHYDELASLPALEATVDSVLESHRMLRDLFLPIARQALGDRFPSEWAAAVLERTNSLLGKSFQEGTGVSP